ncbi:MAG: ATP-binding cassette domain-containing protein [Actinomycetia bacterium]|nr:ATP-binding cassette domain-containing protein [Actinomycetes bacterium]
MPPPRDAGIASWDEDVEEAQLNTETRGGPPVALKFERVLKFFGVVRALDNVSLDVQAGTIHGAVGQNGAGKSTLMRILAGAFHQNGGVIRLGGEELRLRNPDHARRRGIRIIHQELTLVPALSVAENVSLGGNVAGDSERSIVAGCGGGRASSSSSSAMGRTSASTGGSRR